MDSLKKTIHPHKPAHHSDDSTTHPTTTTTQHGNVLSGSDTGDNIANPFTEQNATAAEHFRRNNAATEPSVTGNHRHAPAQETHVGQHTDHHHGAGAGVSASTQTGRDERVPGVDTGGAKVVEARMPVEEGNNFPGTNPHPAHNALGTEGGGGLKYPGGE
ncbi:hypothetical protein CONLIGDRAFT_682695 [Coniochaeta ligniaria NRRL 30616]|uniref:Uncharacterized protein n=1 Tax=Coniochaeta ligniaria NRRL 30616 TaxID=1408157 RepID=A0A1J7JEJ1_9PEZI|nr:hypothetical protein CONLIGDRAFT_682695 [Coniochaeta ligniaria NRRL 30616]